MIHAVPKPQRTPKRAPRQMRSRGQRGAAFPQRKHRPFRTWLRTENPCLFRGRRITRRFSANDWALPGGGFVHRCFGPIDPAHVGDRTQAGGAGDLGECVPWCRAVHRCYDQGWGRDRAAFAQATGFTERELANRAGGYGLKYVERGGAAYVAQQGERKL